MKMSKEHYEYIKNKLWQLSTENLEEHWENLKVDDRVKDMDTRFRWDCFYACGLSGWAIKNLYTLGLHDAHIDTALRKIIKELNYPCMAKE